MIRILAIGRFSGMDCTQDLWVWWIHPEQKTFVPIRSKTHDLNKNKPNSNLILDKYHNCQELARADKGMMISEHCHSFSFLLQRWNIAKCKAHIPEQEAIVCSSLLFTQLVDAFSLLFQCFPSSFEFSFLHRVGGCSRSIIISGKRLTSLPLSTNIISCRESVAGNEAS